MEIERVPERDGWRRAAWFVIWTLLGLLAFVSLVALGHLVRAVGTRLLILSGTFGPMAGLVRATAVLLVVLGALILPVIVIVRLIRARRASPGSGAIRAAMSPAILIGAASVVLVWSAVAEPFGPLDTGPFVNFPPTLFYLGLVLVAIGVALFANDPRFVNAAGHQTTAGTDQTAPIVSPRIRRPRRERSHLGTLTVGVLCIVIASLGLWGSFGAAKVDVRTVPALALTVLGGGIFLGTWIGRARWLTILCVLTLPFVAAANVIDVPIAGGIGDVSYVASGSGPIRTSYRYGIGNMTVDFSALKPSDAEPGIEVILAAGGLSVEVPQGVHVLVDASVRAGDIQLTRRDSKGNYRSDIYRSGADLHVVTSYGSSSPGLIHLIVHAGVGSIHIYPSPSGPSKSGSPGKGQ